MMIITITITKTIKKNSTEAEEIEVEVITSSISKDLQQEEEEEILTTIKDKSINMQINSLKRGRLREIIMSMGLLSHQINIKLGRTMREFGAKRWTQMHKESISM